MQTLFKKYRIIMMGTPDFAIPTAQALLDSGHEIVAIYSQPARKSGRGHKVQHSPLAQWALQHSIPVETPTSLRKQDAQEKFANYKPDIAVVAAYGLLLPKAILNTPPLGCINVHASLLPRWRGAAPIHHAIWAGDQQTGVCIMQMDAGLDTGDILKQQALTIEPDDTTGRLHNKLADLGATLTIKTLQAPFAPAPQSEEHITYAHKVDKQQGRLDFSQPAEAIERHIRAFTPWPGAWFMFEDMVIKVTQATIIPTPINAKPGIVLDDSLTIACGDQALQLGILQRPGGKLLPRQAFLNGYAIARNSQL